MVVPFSFSHDLSRSMPTCLSLVLSIGVVLGLPHRHTRSWRRPLTFEHVSSVSIPPSLVSPSCIIYHLYTSSTCTHLPSNCMAFDGLIIILDFDLHRRQLPSARGSTLSSNGGIPAFQLSCFSSPQRHRWAPYRHLLLLLRHEEAQLHAGTIRPDVPAPRCPVSIVAHWRSGKYVVCTQRLSDVEEDGGTELGICTHTCRSGSHAQRRPTSRCLVMIMTVAWDCGPFRIVA